MTNGTVKQMVIVAILAAGALLATRAVAQQDDRRGDERRENRRENRRDENDGDRDDRGSRDDVSERYAIIVDKNIFVRARNYRPPSARNDRRNSDGPPRRPEDSLVLRGITLQEGQPVAFVEDTRSNSTERYVLGRAIAGGRIARVRLDYIEYEAGGRRTRVNIGSTFSGAAAPTASPSARPGAPPSRQGASPTTAPASASGTAGAGDPTATAPVQGSPDDPNLSIEERMKLRRQQELRR